MFYLRFIIGVVCSHDTALLSMQIDKKSDLALDHHHEFMHKASINGLVSYLYYPSQRFLTFGHAEIEVEGTIKTLLGNPQAGLEKTLNNFLQELYFGERTLDARIRAFAKGKGRPFIRFTFSVSPAQLQTLTHNINAHHAYSAICSKGVLQEISRSIDYTVPAPFTWMPLLSAIYLSSAYALGSSRIKAIQFYGHTGTTKNIKTCILGIIPESTCLFIVLWVCFKCVY